MIKRLEKLLAAKAKADKVVKEILKPTQVKPAEEPVREAGNPGMRSPASVSRDKRYRVVSETMASTWPQSVKIVVQHLGTERYFAASYSIGDDDSDADLSTEWHQVKPKTKTVTEYE